MGKKPFISVLISIGILSLLSGMAESVRAMGKGPEVPLVTKEQLFSMMGKPDVVILDVRESGSWKESKQKFQGGGTGGPGEGHPGMV